MRRALVVSVALNLALLGVGAWFLCSDNDIRDRLATAQIELARSQDNLDELGRVIEREREGVERERVELEAERERLADERSRLAYERSSNLRAVDLIDDSLRILEQSGSCGGKTGSGE